MPAIHTEAFQVRHYECDAYGHMNNAVYLRYMQEAGIKAAAAAGFNPEWHHTNGRTWLPRRIEIEYLQALKAGDPVVIKTWVSGFRRVFCRREYEFYRGGEDQNGYREECEPEGEIRQGKADNRRQNGTKHNKKPGLSDRNQPLTGQNAVDQGCDNVATGI